MAGIGFTLRKVIARGELGSTVRAALSGILIVAGPWILSIITLSLINRYLAVVMAENSGLFIAQLVYTYSSSLILFSPIHLLFTRLIADLIWENRESEASRLLLWFCAVTAVLSAAVAAPAFFLMPLEGLARPGLFRWASLLFFVFINQIWVILLFTSLLRWYGRILAYMSLGMAVSIALIWLWGRSAGLAGAMMGFALGHGLIVVLLLALGLTSHRPRRGGQSLKDVLDYAKRYRHLILAGTLANAAIWIDKIIYWFTRGAQVPGSMYHIFAGYDVAVYYANLIMVPGLVYFVIFGETGFYTYLRKFLITLTSGTYVQLQKTKFAMIRGMRREIGNQQIFQAGITLVAILLAPSMFPAGGEVPAPFFQVTAASVFFQLLLVTIINYLYYFELYRLALKTAGLYLGLNILLTVAGEIAAALTGFAIPPGISITLAVISASLYGYFSLESNAKKMDRIILTR
jgi:uncharacterized membrane protein